MKHNVHTWRMHSFNFVISFTHYLLLSLFPAFTRKDFLYIFLSGRCSLLWVSTLSIIPVQRFPGQSTAGAHGRNPLQSRWSRYWQRPYAIKQKMLFVGKPFRVSKVTFFKLTSEFCFLSMNPFRLLFLNDRLPDRKFGNFRAPENVDLHADLHKVRWSASKTCDMFGCALVFLAGRLTSSL